MSRLPQLAGAVLVVCSFCSDGPPCHAQALPLGPEFWIPTDFIHMPASLAIDGDGWALMAWTEFFSLSGYACGLEPTGNTLWCSEIDPFLAEVYRSVRPTDIVAVAAGDFLLVWEGYREPLPSPPIIKGRRISIDGSFLTEQFDVTAGDSSSPLGPRVAVLPGSTVVVVWADDSSEGTDDSGLSIQARYLTTDGLQLGPRFQVNTTTDGDQTEADVVAASDGRFAVTWQSESSAGSDIWGTSIQLQRFGSDGLPSGGEQQVNTYISFDQTLPRLSMAADGSSVVVWESQGSSGTDDSDQSVQARRFDASGDPLGPDFQVNSYVLDRQSRPVVGVMDSGGFEVVWESDGSPGSDDDGFSIQRQAFTASGEALGPQLQVNTTISTMQRLPDQAMTGNGDFVVVWSDAAAGFDFRGQVFQQPVFADGFESGDTSAWSDVGG